MTSTPAGWYDDGHGAMRWWDGSQWTEHTQPAAGDDVVVPTPPVDAPDSDARLLPPVIPPAPGTLPSPVGPVAPGTYTQTAAELPPPSPAKRGWLIPVILGGSFLLLVILAIVFVPMLVKAIAAGGYSDDERAAVEAVTDYDEAWQSADCEAFEATTTIELRADLSVPDCAAFEEASAGFQEATDDYELAVTEVTTESGVITVRTDETYTSYEDDGGSTVPGFDAHSVIDYTLVESDGAWLIDATVYVEEQPNE